MGEKPRFILFLLPEQNTAPLLFFCLEGCFLRMHGSHWTRALHHSSKEGNSCSGHQIFKLFLGKKVSHLNQVFDGLLFQFGLEFNDFGIFGTDGLYAHGWIGEEFSEFQTF